MLSADGNIIQPITSQPSVGLIVPNIYVGKLNISVCDIQTHKKIGSFDLEIRSIKTEYRSEYQFMLEQITEKCSELLLKYDSPVHQHFKIDPQADAQTLYQRFAFLKSVLESEDFEVAIHRITSNPVTNWLQTEDLRDIRAVKKFSRNVIRQLASATNRIAVPSNHTLRNYGLASIPEKVVVQSKIETLDTAENRFIKHALEAFKNLCEDFRTAAKNHSRLFIESGLMIDHLDEYLNHNFFKEIKRPDTLPLNSPVLQRKEGYREVLRVWLMINLAAMLTWKGGDDVYKGGKKDVATLYEYWLFFRLLDLIEEIFELGPLNPEDFIEETNDKLGLKLKQGEELSIEGSYTSGSRKLNVKFSFNRTFSEASKYPHGGSWTRRMRPDYTLSIWPDGLSEVEAEQEEFMVHIHFDAKYKVDDLSKLFGQDEENLDLEKKEQSKGSYKRADLLKMHAYRDAIRRTAGAYVLYPGEKSTNWQGFHELLPGLGAFVFRPNRDNDGSSELKQFLKNVIEHLQNRVSQREKKKDQIYKVHSDIVKYELPIAVPEKIRDTRIIPDEAYVLVGYSPDKERLKWTLENNLYNVRYETGNGGIELNPKTVGARFLLLYGSALNPGSSRVSGSIYVLDESGPKIYTSPELISLGYPGEEKDYGYVVYSIKEDVSEQFLNKTWDVSKLEGYNPARAIAGKPIFVKLSDLMKAEDLK